MLRSAGKRSYSLCSSDSVYSVCGTSTLNISLEFWIPVIEAGPPAFSAWLRLSARRWNNEAAARQS
jgi:hypothetical protein